MPQPLCRLLEVRENLLACSSPCLLDNLVARLSGRRGLCRVSSGHSETGHSHRHAVHNAGSSPARRPSRLLQTATQQNKAAENSCSLLLRSAGLPSFSAGPACTALINCRKGGEQLDPVLQQQSTACLRSPSLPQYHSRACKLLGYMQSGSSCAEPCHLAIV